MENDLGSAICPPEAGDNAVAGVISAASVAWSVVDERHPGVGMFLVICVPFLIFFYMYCRYFIGQQEDKEDNNVSEAMRKTKRKKLKGNNGGANNG